MSNIFTDPELDARFRRDGWVVVPLLTPPEIEKLIQLQQKMMPEVANDFFATPFSSEEAYRAAIHDAVSDVLRHSLTDIMPDFDFNLGVFVAKRTNTTQGRLPCHMDYSMVDYEKHSCVHLWCPLLDVDESNGCLWLVTGSHEFFNHISSVNDNPRPYEDLLRLLEDTCSTSVPMKAGSAVLFDERMLHWSDENRTNRLRIAVGGVLFPKGVSPLLYMWDKEKPNLMNVLEIPVGYLTKFKVGEYLKEPYPNGVRYLKTIPYTVSKLTAEDIGPLQKIPSESIQNHVRTPIADDRSNHRIFTDPEFESLFRRDGFVVVPLLNSDDIRKLTELHQNTTPELPRDYYATPFSTEMEYRERIRHGVNNVLLPRIEKLVPHFYPCLSSYVSKRGKSQQGKVSLHQDFSTVDASKHTALHVWCPLIDVDESNGCLRAVVGSHTYFNHISSFTFNPAPFDPVRGLLEKHCSTSVPMKAGSAFIFDERLLHWSDENMSDTLRIAVGCIMIPERVSPLLYMWDKNESHQLTVLEMSVDYLTRLKVGEGIEKPYPEGVTFVKTIPYEFKVLTSKDLGTLQTSPIPEKQINGPTYEENLKNEARAKLQQKVEQADMSRTSRKRWVDRIKKLLRI